MGQFRELERVNQRLTNMQELKWGRAQKVRYLGAVLLFCLTPFAVACSGSEDDSDESSETEDTGSGGSQAAGGASSTSEDDGLRMCCEIGAICHVVGNNDSDDIAECHNIGHRNDPEECGAEYERCMTACAGTNDDPVEHGCL